MLESFETNLHIEWFCKKCMPNSNDIQEWLYAKKYPINYKESTQSKIDGIFEPPKPRSQY